MNRNQFQTYNNQSDNFKAINSEDIPVYSFNENESDSGEDFDYGEEEGDGGINIDLMDCIKNIDASNFKGISSDSGQKDFSLS